MVMHMSMGQWLLALGVFVACSLTLRAATALVARSRRAEGTTPHRLIDTALASMGQRTYAVFHLAMGIAAASWFLPLPPPWIARVRTGAALLGIVQGGIWGSALVHALMARVFIERGDAHTPAGRDAHRSGRIMLRFLGLTLVWCTAGLLMLDILGVSVTTLIAGLGVTGIAVALATQQIFGDLFASVSILLDRPFLVGDFINVDTFFGTVEQIGIRSTRIRSLSGEAIIFANSDLSKNRVRNFADQYERRVVFNFSLPPDTDVDLACDAAGMLKDAICALPNVRFDRSHWIGFGANALLFEAAYYVLSGDYTLYMDTQQRLNAGLLRRLRAARLEPMFGMSVHLHAPEALRWLATSPHAETLRPPEASGQRR